MKNFGKIKNAYYNLLAESIGCKNASESKNLFKEYIKTIRESEILKTQFIVYSNIEEMTDDNASSAVNFISENVNIMRRFKPEDIIKENKKLLSLSKNINGVDKIMTESYDMAQLHTSLSNLICTERTPRNLTELSNDLKVVVNHIKKAKTKTINESVDLPQSLLANMMVDKFNDKYSSLDESNRKAVKSILDSNTEEKKEIHEELIRECISLIDAKMTSSDLTAKEKLLKAKDKLLNDKMAVLNEDEFIEKISKIIELKNGLETN
jgi:Arc/MetJ-type ribon-helix-helix transcriptional regulator